MAIIYRIFTSTVALVLMSSCTTSVSITKGTVIVQEEANKSKVLIVHFSSSHDLSAQAKKGVLFFESTVEKFSHRGHSLLGIGSRDVYLTGFVYEDIDGGSLPSTLMIRPNIKKWMYKALIFRNLKLDHSSGTKVDLLEDEYRIKCRLRVINMALPDPARSNEIFISKREILSALKERSGSEP